MCDPDHCKYDAWYPYSLAITAKSLIHEIRPPSIANVFSAILMVDSL